MSFFDKIDHSKIKKNQEMAKTLFDPRFLLTRFEIVETPIFRKMKAHLSEIP